MSDRVRVLIVDDSRIFRAALEESLGGEEVKVVGSVFSGEKAIEFLRSAPPDVVTLDVEMQGMDGLQTLEAIKRWNACRPAGVPEVGVIMVSALTRRGAEVTMRALQAGAIDFVTKPSSTSAEESIASLRQQLVPKIRQWSLARKSAARRGGEGSSATLPALRASPRTPRTVRAVVIASSTGGPCALQTLLPDLCSRVDVPILIVQHMPSGIFTRAMADHLSRTTRRKVVEAGDNETILPRTVYLAPIGKHMLLRYGTNGMLMTALNEQPPENGCRPSADVLFRSAATVLGGEVVAVVLTGMDCDGTAGLRPLKRAGAYVLVQDEASSVVWGMPGNVVKAGLADEVLPLARLGEAVQELVAARGAR
jgi:two-component system chemotaxis response regulator CheB